MGWHPLAELQRYYTKMLIRLISYRLVNRLYSKVDDLKVGNNSFSMDRQNEKYMDLLI